MSVYMVIFEKMVMKNESLVRILKITFQTEYQGFETSERHVKYAHSMVCMKTVINMT